MNKISAAVVNIQNVQNLTQVTFTTATHELKMIGLELPQQIEANTKVTLTCKATNIAIAKTSDMLLSFSNQLHVTVKKIEMGALLCALELSFESITLESIITADSAKRMNLQLGESVVALIKSSDLSIAEVLS
ncbi:MAG: TOBE domain-containing protein [Epsilonproteobacteria bacterium]|nr:TOBE domain-containing protein [Campylobacterota bacterium]